MEIYRGIVVNNKDPKMGGRVQVRIFNLHGISDTFSESNYEAIENKNLDDKDKVKITNENLPWAEVMQPIDYIGFFNTNHFDKNEKDKFNIDGQGKTNSKNRTPRDKGERRAGFGYNRILEIGTWVFCILDHDNPNMPIVIGTIASNTEYNKFTSPTQKRYFESTSGHFENFEDTPGKENIQIHHRTGTDIEFAPDGNLETQVVKDNHLYVMKNDFSHIQENKLKYIHGDETNHIIGNHKENIDGNETRQTKGNLQETINGNETNKISGNLEETIGGNETNSISGNLNKTIGGNETNSISGSLNENVGGSWTQNTSGSVTISGSIVTLNGMIYLN